MTSTIDYFRVVASYADGHFNENGEVDGSDITSWMAGFGKGARHSRGDAGGDHDIDGADVLFTYGCDSRTSAIWCDWPSGRCTRREVASFVRFPTPASYVGVLSSPIAHAAR